MLKAMTSRPPCLAGAATAPKNQPKPGMEMFLVWSEVNLMCLLSLPGQQMSRLSPPQAPAKRLSCIRFLLITKPMNNPPIPVDPVTTSPALKPAANVTACRDPKKGARSPWTRPCITWTRTLAVWAATGKRRKTSPNVPDAIHSRKRLLLETKTIAVSAMTPEDQNTGSFWV